MGRKKTGAIPTVPPREKEKMVIDMNRVARAKAYHSPGFRTGRHMSQKDRPRKKDWKREYERKSGQWGDRNPGPIFFIGRIRPAADRSEGSSWKLSRDCFRQGVRDSIGCFEAVL
ncbi:MAG: hypothetical protein UIL73_02930 [Anaerovoracaceae bacterium]|nr:hypothetical protein [Anaerovoracaceae bacterium]